MWLKEEQSIFMQTNWVHLHLLFNIAMVVKNEDLHQMLHPTLRPSKGEEYEKTKRLW